MVFCSLSEIKEVTMCPSKERSSTGKAEDEGEAIDTADNNFFEGVEKLLEVWFASRRREEKNKCDLRKIPR